MVPLPQHPSLYMLICSILFWRFFLCRIIYVGHTHVIHYRATFLAVLDHPRAVLFNFETIVVELVSNREIVATGASCSEMLEQVLQAADSRAEVGLLVFGVGF